jgi:hypothetical protein
MDIDNGIKHYITFVTKMWLFSIFEFGLKRPKKNPAEPQEAIMRTVNYAFWMKLNTTLKILVFCISSF